MRRFLCAALALLVGGASLPAKDISPPGPAAAIPPAQNLPAPASTLTVLCYHNIDLASSKDSPYSVTSAQFMEQLNALKSAGFTFVSLEQVLAFYASGTPLPSRSVLVTFDDGHLNIYEHAYPILKSMGIPWLLFIFPTAIGRGHEKGFMNWDEIRALRRDGVAIGSHSFDHPYLARPGDTAAAAIGYDAWLDKELVYSKTLIEKNLGEKISAFAAPFGDLNEAVQRHIAAAGYSLAFNIFGSNNDARSDPLQLNRLLVLSPTSGESLAKRAGELPLHCAMLQPRPLQAFEGDLKALSFSLAADEYVPDSIRVLVNGELLKTLKIEGSVLTAEISGLVRPKGCIVRIYARKKTGASCSQSYYFYYAGGKQYPPHSEPAPLPAMPGA